MTDIEDYGEALLSIRGVALSFGGIVALDGVGFDTPRGCILGLIGPNGSGKTTLFNCLSRLYTPSAGEIHFNGENLQRLAPHEVARSGIGRTFQNLALFPSLTVLQNVMVGGQCRTRSRCIAAALRLPGVRAEEEAMEIRAWECIHALGLGTVAYQPAGDLPFGTLKRVELARALATAPRLLMLDEPAGGLNHEEVAELAELIRQLREDRDLTILLVEHHMGLVMDVSDRVVALNFGRAIAEGTPAEVQRDPEVVRAYLGNAGASA